MENKRRYSGNKLGFIANVMRPYIKLTARKGQEGFFKAWNARSLAKKNSSSGNLAPTARIQSRREKKEIKAKKDPAGEKRKGWWSTKVARAPYLTCPR